MDIGVNSPLRKAGDTQRSYVSKKRNHPDSFNENHPTITTRKPSFSCPTFASYRYISSIMTIHTDNVQIKKDPQHDDVEVKKNTSIAPTIKKKDEENQQTAETKNVCKNVNVKVIRQHYEPEYLLVAESREEDEYPLEYQQGRDDVEVGSATDDDDDVDDILRNLTMEQLELVENERLLLAKTCEAQEIIISNLQDEQSKDRTALLQAEGQIQELQNQLEQQIQQRTMLEKEIASLREDKAKYQIKLVEVRKKRLLARPWERDRSLYQRKEDGADHCSEDGCASTATIFISEEGMQHDYISIESSSSSASSSTPRRCSVEGKHVSFHVPSAVVEEEEQDNKEAATTTTTKTIMSQQPCDDESSTMPLFVDDSCDEESSFSLSLQGSLHDDHDLIAALYKDDDDDDTKEDGFWASSSNLTELIENASASSTTSSSSSSSDEETSTATASYLDEEMRSTTSSCSEKEMNNDPFSTERVCL
eukprot:scaffold6966_cov112-Cylindrotheca_fusiformis.AAC.11